MCFLCPIDNIYIIALVFFSTLLYLSINICVIVKVDDYTAAKYHTAFCCLPLVYIVAAPVILVYSIYFHYVHDFRT